MDVAGCFEQAGGEQDEVFDGFRVEIPEAR
jgi:hypothetical protein